MKKRSDTLFGLTAVQYLVLIAVGSLCTWLVGFLPGLVVGVAVGMIFQFANYRQKRPEAAWEISEKGTRQLWNDGPKEPVSYWDSSK